MLSRVLLSQLPASAALLVLALPAARAQNATPSTAAILAGVRSNLHTFVATMPNIFCSEHIRSMEIHNGKLKHPTEVDSTIRAVREPDGTFREERTIERINGKPSKKRTLSLPLTLKGGFGITFPEAFSPANESCNTYTVDPEPNAGNLVLHVRRNAKATDASCKAIPAGSRAQFMLDPVTLQIRTYVRENSHAGGPKGYTQFEGSVEFARVTLGAKSYLIPTHVHASLRKISGKDELEYDAAYSDCHRFGSTATILTAPLTGQKE